MFNYNLYGLGVKFKNIIIKRFELTTFVLYYSNIFYITNYFNQFFKKFEKTLNIILSQVNNVNLTVQELKKINIVRKYLIKSYQGYCHAIGKPVRGQRTWSNGWNSFKCNNLLRNFITKIRQLNALSESNKTTKIDYRTVKKKYTLNVNKGGKGKNNINENRLLPKTSWY